MSLPDCEVCGASATNANPTTKQKDGPRTGQYLCIECEQDPDMNPWWDVPKSGTLTPHERLIREKGSETLDNQDDM